MDLDLLKVLTDRTATTRGEWVEAEQAVSAVLHALQDNTGAYSDLWERVYSAIKDIYAGTPDWED